MYRLVIVSVFLLAACSTPEGYHWCHTGESRVAHLVADKYQDAEKFGPHMKLWAHAIIADKEKGLPDALSNGQ